MLSKADNLKMCQTDAGTPMGEAMRRFWIPVLPSEYLEADGAPRRVELLGETFVAFRNTAGEVGILDEQCCHRSASLVLGRVEDCGIRCLFHGWKFAIDGTIMETPNVSDPRFKTRFRAKSYPIREAGGFIWTYIGEKGTEPEFKRWPYFDVAPDHRLTVSFVVDDCNFVQLGEALLDSSHLTILHQDIFKRTSDSPLAVNVSNASVSADPRMEVDETEFGLHYAAIREVPTEDGPQAEARVTSFFAPFYYLNANGNMIGMIIPMTDTRTLHHFVWWDDEKPLANDPYRADLLGFAGLTDAMLRQIGVHHENWQEPGKPSRANNFHQDRVAMKQGSFSGLPVFFPEDHAMLVSSGAIRDRSKEILAPADLAIARLYRVLLRLADTVARGEEPRCLHVDPMDIRGMHALIEDGKGWRDLVPAHVPFGRDNAPRVPA